MTDSALPLARLSEVNHKFAKLIGRVPWRIRVQGQGHFAVIIDADSNCLSLMPSKIAGRIVAAVNLVECAHQIERDPRRLDEQS